MLPVAWTIAGSDPSGGAGLQADLATFHQHRVHGCGVVSLLTVQSRRVLSAVQVVDAALVGAQLDALGDDLPPAALKTGALGNAAVVEAVAERVATLGAPLVVDPVAVATLGATLLDDAGRRALVERLLPLCALVTPNAAEASVLSGVRVVDVESASAAARAIASMGPGAVLVTGGHLTGDADEAVDVLHLDGRQELLRGARVDGLPAHGLGCALSAAITARLARGETLGSACRGAKAWVARALAGASGGGGALSLLDHHAPTDD